MIVALGAVWALVLILLGATAFVFHARGEAAHGPQSSGAAGQTWFTGVRWQPQARVFHAPGFTLRDQRGTPVTLRQFRGRVVLLTFTSAICTGQCPVVGRTAATAGRMLGPLAARTVLVNVSVSPEGDTPGAVRTFLRDIGWTRYHSYYLSAPRTHMQPVWRAYGIYDPPPVRGKKKVDPIHTAAVGIIDQSGNVRGFFSYPFPASVLVHGVRDLIAASA
jgi:cytochrome oxidase Cu insertion factor (SCO1/SenC/PrrC family)